MTLRKIENPASSLKPKAGKTVKGGNNVDVWSFLAIASYTIAVFSLGYSLGKDLSRKQK